MLRNYKSKKQQGFTLIELMIVIAIIGILAAIAIPQFAAYRVRSFNSSGQSDTRNAATSEAAFFSDWLVFGVSEVNQPGAGGGAAGAGALLTGPSDGTNAIITATDSTGNVRDLQVGLGNRVMMIVSTDAAQASSFIVISKHIQGDTMYGTDSDTTAIFQDPETLGVGNVLTGAQLPVVSVVSQDDFTGVAEWGAK